MSFTQSQYNHLEEEALSIDQINSIMKKGVGVTVPIIELHKLNNIHNIDQILPNNSGAVIYIPINSPNAGHYNGIFRYNNIIYWLDSYGKSIVELVDRVWGAYGKDAWGLDFKFSQLLIDSKMPVYMNTFKHYQTQDTKDDTCGRWSTSVLLFFYDHMNRGEPYDLNTYHDLITEYKNKYKLATYDDAVIHLTEPLI